MFEQATFEIASMLPFTVATEATLSLVRIDILDSAHSNSFSSLAPKTILSSNTQHQTPKQKMTSLLHPTSQPQIQMSLPTPRALLTSLITAISTIPLLPEPGPEPKEPPADPAERRAAEKCTLSNNSQSNPLRRVPPSHRHLITTLHVLFPSLLLPALDALERGLVGRVTLVSHSDAATAGSGHLGRERERERERGGDRDRNSIYLVHSAAAAASATEGRRRRGAAATATEGNRDLVGSAGAGRLYIVRLGAWHCTCAGFAFAAVLQGGGMAGRERGEEEAEEEQGVSAGTELDWSFGGMSCDGLDLGAGDTTGEGVPVCKHLLACLLAERWSVALGRYVVEWRVGREEMAGIVADV